MSESKLQLTVVTILTLATLYWVTIWSGPNTLLYDLVMKP